MATIPGNPHAADAEGSVKILRAWMDREGDTNTAALAVAIEAQAQATLALAYEQRTANLIAAATATYADGTAMFPELIHAKHGETIKRLAEETTR
ncbi:MULTISPECIES: hypothetical protein [Brachybacterium]|uniref:DUF222 domain-containing protein n=1 Tax=Brachybacterium kimchii TaxID=2942909 RepID=A0ABY4N9T2_9MICO|nr:MULTISPECIES: hypothetical protein [Brachybacterium]MCG7309715.1 hypothetical protein [Brachybacterium sp. ACRRE]UQN30562.1 hypothetical protein M4486_04415 [Brachybacterium kimchii]